MASRQGKPPRGRRKITIFRAYVTDPRTHEVRWACDYGLKAWKLTVYV
jgi:hypothetical protein